MGDLSVSRALNQRMDCLLAVPVSPDNDHTRWYVHYSAGAHITLFQIPLHTLIIKKSGSSSIK